MTLSTQQAAAYHTGTGTTGPFSFNFRIDSAAHLRVVRYNTAGAESVLINGVDFTATGIGASAGGSVTLTVALASGERLVIRRLPPIEQPTRLRDQGRFSAVTHEDTFDRLVMHDQAAIFEARRAAFRMPEAYNPDDWTATLPNPLVAGRALVVNPAANGFTLAALDANAVALPGGGRTAATLTQYLANNAVFNVRDFGAVGNGVADDTAAFARAIASMPAIGATLYIPAGTYRTNIQVPGMPKRVHILGDGKGATVLVSAVANTPVIRHLATAPSPTDGVTMRDFTVSPHASGVSGALVDLAGFRWSTLDEVSAADNGAGRCGTVVTLSSIRAGYTNGSCYSNVIRRLNVQQVTPAVGVIVFENDGTANGINNANANIIEQCAFYANTAPYIIDALRSAGTVIRDCIIEGNNGTGIRLGTLTLVSGGWMESNTTDIVFSAGTGDGTSYGTVVENIYFSDGGAITIPAGCNFNVWQNTYEAIAKTFTDNGALNTIRYGSVHSGVNVDQRFRFANAGSGGNVWDLIVSRTGTLVGAAGAIMLRDETNTKNRMVMRPASHTTFNAGASAAAALRVVPHDDASPGTAVLSVLDSAEAVTKGYIEKSGDLNFAGGYRTLLEGFYLENQAAGVSLALMSRLAGTTNNPGAVIALRAGSITGISLHSNAARSAGTMTAIVHVNDVATALTAVLDGTNTTFKATTAAKDTYQFSAGDRLSVRVTTDASWAPTTADVRASIEVEW